MQHLTIERKPRLTPGDLLNLITPALEAAGYEVREFGDADLIVSSGTTVVAIDFEIFDVPDVSGGSPDALIATEDGEFKPDDDDEETIPPNDASWMGDDGHWIEDPRPGPDSREPSQNQGDRFDLDAPIPFLCRGTQ